MISHSVLHILDFQSDLCVFSQEELSLENPEVAEFLEKHMERAAQDTRAQGGTFLEDSPLKEELLRLREGEVSFMDLAYSLAERLYEGLLRTDGAASTDLLIAQVEEGPGSALVALLMNNREAYVHQVIQEDGVVRSVIARQAAVLPSASQRPESFFRVDLGEMKLQFLDRRRTRGGEEVFLLRDEILCCSAGISPGKALKETARVLEEVAQEHGENTAIVMSRARTYVRENAESSPTLLPREMAREVFAGNEAMVAEFEQRAEEQEVPWEIPVEPKTAVKTGKNHRIRTDTGIEITFPAEMAENPEFIEFIRDPDGTLSISLRHIGRIINR